jgi:hypothetical protein
MTVEKSYCFYDTIFARFTAGACFALALLHFAGMLLSGYGSLIVDLESRVSELWQ